MFTGIIEELGRIRRIEHKAAGARLTIAGALIFDDLKLGDSVAVNGVCLTAAAIQGQTFSADVMPETLARSNLGKLQPGSPVNLERAMAANGRFGGHIVSGHIDGQGQIQSLRPDGNALWLRITCGPELLRYVVEKGSITIDGISLTVAEVDDRGFAVSLIPHTLATTTLQAKKNSDAVNLENDIVGKYIERFLQPATAQTTNSNITTEFLAHNGF